MFKTLLHTILDTLFPPLLDSGDIDLTTLAESAVEQRYHFQCVDKEHCIYACAHYSDETISSLVRQLKYKGRRIAAHFLSVLVVRALTEKTTLDSDHAWLLVSVPLSRERERERGYNQAELIARLVADKYPQITLQLHPLLRRNRATKPQTSLDRADRVANVIGAFSADEHMLAQYKNMPILLLDDVATTGATLREARATLLRAGAREVVCIGIAH